MATAKLSDYLISRVADHGAKHVFLVPGGGAMHLNDSLGREKRLTFIGNLHEQASSVCAESYAKVTGRLGVCMVTTGPGATNAVTGLTGAWLDSTPVLFLSGQVKRPDIKEGTGLRQLGNQEIGIIDIVKSVTKYAVTVTDPNRIAYHIDEALYLAHEGRPGPVWLDIPLDVQAATIDTDALPRFTPPAPAKTNDIEALKPLARQTLELLVKAERPVMMGGNGIHVAHAVDAWKKLIETLGIPVQTTWLALDLMEADHPLYAERSGGIAPRSANFTLQNADFFLAIGARMDMAQIGYSPQNYARAAKKVICDIDPAEINKLEKMQVDVPVIADAGAFIAALLAVAPEFKQPDRSAWLKRIKAWQKKYPLIPPAASEGQNKLSAYAFSAALSEAIPEGTMIAPGSSGFGSEIFHLMMKTKKGQRCYHNRGTGSMGFAIPSAIAACFAIGKQPVVSMDGDGGFQFNIQELATIAAHRLPIKMFVYNNAGYASIRSSQNGYFGGNMVCSDESSGLVLPPLEKLVPAYGLRYERIVKGDDVPARLNAILASDGPVVVEVELLADEPREPRLSSYRKEDGSMASKPLEDLFPFLDRDEFHANMLIPTVDA